MMPSFWETARHSAAAEFGRRNYRTYAALAWLKRAGPVLAGLLAAAGVVLAVTGAAESWGSWSHWIPTVVAGLAVAGAVGLLVAFGVWIWRNRWRWWR